MDAFDGSLVLQRAVHVLRQHAGHGPAHLSLACPQAPDAATCLALAHRPAPVFDGCSTDEQTHWQTVWHALAQSLAASAWGLLPGLHRLRLNAGPAPHHPMPDAPAAATPRLFLDLSIGDALRAEDMPRPGAARVARDASVVVVGSGLAGAACARALADRGYTVQVLDGGPTPAAGASGLPVGLVAPHTSPDDSRISRLSRAGVRAMRDALQQHLRVGVDWGDSGVLEHRLPGKTRKGGPPPSWARGWPDAAASWTCGATLDARGLAVPSAMDPTAHANETIALWHAKGAWVRPAALVRALLAHPRIRWQGETRVTHLQRTAPTGRDTGAPGARWCIHTEDGDAIEADQVLLACGPHTPRLLRASGLSDVDAPIQPLRGQLSWGLMADALGAASPAPAHWPRTPVNGNGSFVHGIDTPEGPAWFAGATFDRSRDAPVLLAEDQHENLARLGALLPAVAQDLQAPLARGDVRAWAGVRGSVPDRLPMVGRVPDTPEGLWLCSALGSRGLTLAVLCGEVLAAQWTGEPPPVEAPLLRALSSERFAARRVSPSVRG